MASELLKPSDVVSESTSNYSLEVSVLAGTKGVVLVVSGEVDLYSVPTLTACLDHILDESFESVLVDLSGVTFMDSSGLIVLAKADRRLAGTSRSFGLCNPSPKLHRVLAVSGLDALLVA